MKVQMSILNGMRVILMMSIIVVAFGLIFSEPNENLSLRMWIAVFLLSKAAGTALLLLVAKMGQSWFGWNIKLED